jgi:hypothetical protein
MRVFVEIFTASAVLDPENALIPPCAAMVAQFERIGPGGLRHDGVPVRNTRRAMLHRCTSEGPS